MAILGSPLPLEKTMQKTILNGAIACALAAQTAGLANNTQMAVRGAQEIAAIDISVMSNADLQKLKNNPSYDWWGEFGDTLIVAGSIDALLSASANSNITYQTVWSGIASRDLEIAIAGHKNEISESRAMMLVKSGRTSLIARRKKPIGQEQGPLDHSHVSLSRFVPNTVYVQSSRHDTSRTAWSEEQKSLALSIMGEVDPVRWYLDVGTLSNWNRHVSSFDIVSARDWIKEQFDKLSPTSSTIQKFNVLGRDAWNVIATFDAGSQSDIYIIGGHYDSISERTSEAAPGAEDNATGAAAVLELARVFSDKKSKATLIFITFSGEEEGLVGSKAYVRTLTAGMKSRVKGVLTMDMIGYSKDDSEDVLLETASKFRPLLEQHAAAAKLVQGLRYYTSYNPFGSDHMPFIDNNIPAILTIDNDWGDYPAYHRTSDTIDKVSRDMGAAILRMNAGALANMTGASK